jgi:superfamily II DNA or RNA helicase
MNQPLNLKIGNIFTTVSDPKEPAPLLAPQLKELERELSFRPQGYMFSPAFQRWIKDAEGNPIKRAWSGWKPQFWSSNRNGTFFPTGLLSLAQAYFSKHNIPVQIFDYREKPEPNFDVTASGEYTYRDYQLRVIHSACNKSRGIIQAATGSGKTIMAAGIIEQLRVAPFIFFVTSIDLLEQAKESFEAALRFHGSRLKVGQMGGGVVDIQDVNVCTIQTAVRALGKSWDKQTKFDGEDSDDKTPIGQYRADIREVIREARGAICDEVQHWRADTCQLVARELKSAYYTYGTSATPYRDEGDDMMIQACFGKKIAVITATELIEHPDKWLVRPNIKMVHIKGKRTKFKQWQSIYKDKVVENDYYNGCIANIANAYIGNDRLVLVLVQQIDHGKELAHMIKGAQFLSGKSTKIKRSKSLKQLRGRQISCIVSTTIFDEGIDVRPLDTVILAGQGKSQVRAMQRIGRISRPFTYPDGTVKSTATAIDPVIHDKYLLDHANTREKMYRTEPAYRIEHIEDLS